MLIKSFLLEGNEDLVHKTEWWRKKNLPFYEMKRKHSFLGIKFIQEKSSNLRWAKKKRLNLKFIEKVSLSSKVPSLTKKIRKRNKCLHSEATSKSGTAFWKTRRTRFSFKSFNTQLCTVPQNAMQRMIPCTYPQEL